MKNNRLYFALRILQISKFDPSQFMLNPYLRWIYAGEITVCKLTLLNTSA